MSAHTATPRLWLTETAHLALVEAARRADPLETGGLMLGLYADGVPWVTHIVEVESPDQSRNRFSIPAGRTSRAVETARALDPRLGYLGDWHSHPADIGPSSIDLLTLAAVSVRHPLEPNPTLVVVRRVQEGYELDARRIVSIRPRHCAIDLTGEPAEPPAT